MNYYQEINLLANSADIDLHFLWQKIYQQIHLALVTNKTKDNTSVVGVSFPEYNADTFSLGTKLRLFAKNEQYLKQTQCEKWLSRLKDYTNLNAIKSVPEKIEGYACYKHIKLKGSKEKLARRRAKWKGETLQQALEYFKGFEEQHSKLPYINMQSQTNGRYFRLFIEKQIMDSSSSGLYSCYGLSGTTTVPIF